MTKRRSFKYGTIAYLKLFSLCYSDSSGNYRARIRNNSLSHSITCNVYKVFIEYSEGEDETEYVCDYQKVISNSIQNTSSNVTLANTSHGSTNASANTTNYVNSVTALSMPKQGYIDKYDDIISSGNAVITFPNAKISNYGILLSDDNNNQVVLDVATKNNNRKLVKSTGINSLVVISINGLDGTVTSSTNELSRRFFGGYDDYVNLSSQMSACSFNKLKIVPGKGKGINNGVLGINFESKVTNVESNYLVNEAVVQALKKFNLDLVNDYDFLIFCLPPESTHNNRKFVGYASLNGYRAVFSDQSCTYVTAQMHEVGHLIGLAHSGKKSNLESYGDLSGYMSYNWAGHETPRRCYNAAKSYELGWYEDKTLTMTYPFQDNYSWNGKVSGIVDYDKAIPGEHHVIIKIAQQHMTTMATNTEYICITLNRQKDFNEGTSAYQNEVTIVESSGKSKQSWLLASLKSGERHTLNKIFLNHSSTKNSSLAIQVLSMHLNDTIDYADIQIGIPCSNHTDCNDLIFCNGEEICSSGICKKKISKTLPCDDNNPFTKDQCLDEDEGRCAHKFKLIASTKAIMTGESVTINPKISANDTNKHNITWHVNNKIGGNSKIGYISKNGTYAAPSNVNRKHIFVKISASYDGNHDNNISHYNYGKLVIKVKREAKKAKKLKKRKKRRRKNKIK